MNTKSGSRYLLIVACSQRKVPTARLLPAIQRYDGVNFRVIAKAKREGYWPDNLDVLILSAKYGLIGPAALISDYDLPMTRKRAKELRWQVGVDLDGELGEIAYREVFVNLGKVYLVALALSSELKALDGRVRYATGGIGQKMSEMKAWIKRVSSLEGEG